MGIESSSFSGETVGLQGILQVALHSREELGVSIQAEPEDTGSAGVGECTQGACLQVYRWRSSRNGIDYLGEGGEASVGDVAKEGEGEMSGPGVYPLNALGHEALQSLDVGGN